MKTVFGKNWRNILIQNSFVCNEHIDQVIGYVDAKDILVRILNNQSLLQLNESTIRTVLIIPDTLNPCLNCWTVFVQPKKICSRHQ